MDVIEQTLDLPGQSLIFDGSLLSVKADHRSHLVVLHVTRADLGKQKVLWGFLKFRKPRYEWALLSAPSG